MFENKYFIEMKMAINDTIRTIEKEIGRGGITFKDYMVHRTALNILIVNAVTGSELTVNGSDAKCKFNKRLPSFEQVGEIVNILDKYIDEVENPFLESVEEAVLEKRASENKDDEDMGIPDKSESSVNFNAYHRSVPFVKKSTNKELKKLFSNNRSFINGLMKPHDIYVLYDLGKRARSNANFKKGLIIGGVATIVACTAGVIFFKRRKGNEEKPDDGMTDKPLGLRSELSDIDIPVIEYTETDIPVIPDTEIQTEVPAYNVELNAL